MAKKYDHFYGLSKRYLESWINDALEEIESPDDERIEGIFVAIKAAHPFDLVTINDELIAAEELLREKGVDVGRHMCMPRQIGNLLGWS